MTVVGPAGPPRPRSPWPQVPEVELDEARGHGLQYLGEAAIAHGQLPADALNRAYEPDDEPADAVARIVERRSARILSIPQARVRLGHEAAHADPTCTA